MKLLTVLAFVLVAGAFAGCKYFRGQIVDGPGMEREVDSLETDSVSLADDGKHTVDYIRQRVDAMYACYKNPKYDESGYRLMQRVNLDSAYCSLRYKALLSKAVEMAGDDDIVIDYDHWTNSQDDNNFTYEVGRIDQITDSTAFAEIYGKNYGNDYTIVLGLFSVVIQGENFMVISLLLGVINAEFLKRIFVFTELGAEVIRADIQTQTLA